MDLYLIIKQPINSANWPLTPFPPVFGLISDITSIQPGLFVFSRLVSVFCALTVNARACVGRTSSSLAPFIVTQSVKILSLGLFCIFLHQRIKGGKFEAPRLPVSRGFTNVFRGRSGMGWMLRGTKTSILKVKTVSTSKPWTDSGFTAPQMSFKAIKLAELRHQGHLRIIALSDFRLALPVPAKFSIFARSSSTTENIKNHNLLGNIYKGFYKDVTWIPHRCNLFRTYF